MTIDEIFQVCYSEHWNCERFIQSGHAKEVLSKYKNHIKPTFGELNYLQIKRAQIRDWHIKFREMPITGNRCLEIMSKLYKFAQDKEWIDNYNPCIGVKHFVERKRKRFATEKEIKLLGDIMTRLQPRSLNLF